MTTPTRGNLVQALIDAAGDRARAMRDVVDVLHKLFPAWRQRFPAGLCWKWVPPRGIEVYEVLGCNDDAERERTAAAADHLFDRGFVSVQIHDHPPERKLLTCVCPTHEPKART